MSPVETATPATPKTSKQPGVPGELYTRSSIEIYTNTLSAAPGDTVTLHVSTTAERFEVCIERVGAKECLVWQKRNIPGRFWATPPDAWKSGCGWPASVTLTIPPDWPSGFY